MTHVSEVLGYDVVTQTYQMQDIYVREYQGFGPNGEIISEIVPANVPTCLAQLHEHGMDMPASFYAAMQARGQS